MCKDNFVVFKENGFILMNLNGMGWLQEKSMVAVWNFRAVSAFSWKQRNTKNDPFRDGWP